MGGLFDFSSVMMNLLLLICACTYARDLWPGVFDSRSKPRDPSKPVHHDRDGVLGFCWKLSRIGERLSPYVGAACLFMGLYVLLFK
ncbi:DUF1242 domain containing protein [Nitzschia inconspicua]|uniref:Protein kish n=1 Tax=Nitzschia inconspicua TaxID=303405 RepID=A0A9K3PEJ3_9STRA|nr:DUF1242 domain containing protein [Nitzschia inconspicua]